MAKPTVSASEQRLQKAIAEEQVQRHIEQKLKRATNLVQFWVKLTVESVGIDAAMELIANAQADLEDERHRRQLVRQLRGDPP
jgi:hypothetical protein